MKCLFLLSPGCFSSTPDNLLFDNDIDFDQFMVVCDCFTNSSQALTMPWH